MKRIVLALTFALTITALAPQTRADTFQWTLNDITFNDGGTAKGAFTFNVDTTTLSNIAITTTTGAAFAGTSYSVVPSALAYAPGPSNLFFATSILSDYTGSTLLFLEMEDPLTDAGGNLPLIAVEYRCRDATCIDANPIRTGKGFVAGLPGGAPVPETMALTLIGAGLAALCIARKVHPYLRRSRT